MAETDLWRFLRIGWMGLLGGKEWILDLRIEN
jgi:hypothetical protein